MAQRSGSSISARRVAWLACLWFGATVTACGSGSPANQATDDGGESQGESQGQRTEPPSSSSPGTASESESAPRGDVTWHVEIAPLVASHCSGCHREGGIAPFSLESYEQAKPVGELSLQAVRERRMPPWAAHPTDECEPRFGFKDDLRLSNEQIQLFEAWVEGGMLEGGPQGAAPLPAPPALDLEDADLALAIPTEVSVSGTRDQFLCFSLDPQLTADEWVVASQVTAGNAAIVHHVLVYVDPLGQSATLGDDGVYPCFGGPEVDDAELLVAWAPGGVPMRLPPQAGLKIPAGARLVMNVHYHPTGAGEERDDSTTLELQFSEAPPRWAASVALLGNFSGPHELGGLLPGPADPADGPEFRIPAGAEDHTESMRVTLPERTPESVVWAVGAHMHYVGTDQLIRIGRPAAGDQPEQECLLQTPQWDFNWQRSYLYDGELAELPRVRGGDVVNIRCTYDNSLGNRFVREALAEQGLEEPRDVLLGDESLDEMCLGVFGSAVLRK